MCVSLSVFIENVTSAIVYVTGIDYSRSKMEYIIIFETYNKLWSQARRFNMIIIQLGR